MLGWTNKSTWRVAVWFEEEMEQLARKNRDVESLAEQLQEAVIEGNPLKDQSNLYCDFINVALCDVNWQELAFYAIENTEEEDAE